MSGSNYGFMDKLTFGLNAKSREDLLFGTLRHLAGLGRRWRGGGGSRRIAATRAAAAAAAVEAKSVSRSKDKRRSTASDRAREGKGPTQQDTPPRAVADDGDRTHSGSSL